MTQRALITGASGFVGPVLRAHLEAGGWETVCIGQAGEGGLPGCDITDRVEIDALLDHAGAITHVFHLAAMTFVPAAHRDPTTAMQVNLLGTIQLTNALRDRDSKARFVNIGSAEAYGPPQFLPVTEAHPLNPGNPYAISKAAADHYCAYLAKSGALDVVRVRPFNHSGPGQTDQFVLSSFARQIAEIEAGLRAPEIHVGNLTASRDFLHVNDVVRAYEALALRGQTGAAYNVCSGVARSIEEALHILLALSTARPKVVPDPARMRPVDVPVMYGSYDQIMHDTGWRPEHELEYLLTELLHYWRTQVTTEPASA
jgi:GDP-4-dehydro-6-deoxy-D-mannose reductase